MPKILYPIPLSISIFLVQNKLLQNLVLISYPTHVKSLLFEKDASVQEVMGTFLVKNGKTVKFGHILFCKDTTSKLQLAVDQYGAASR